MMLSLKRARCQSQPVGNTGIATRTYDGGDEHFSKLNIDASSIVRGRLHFDPVGNKGWKNEGGRSGRVMGGCESNDAPWTQGLGETGSCSRAAAAGLAPRCWDDGNLTFRYEAL